MAGAPMGGGQPQQAQQNPFQQASGAYNTAMNATGQAMGQAMNAPDINIRDVNAGQLSGTNLNPYMNPYQEQVIDQSMSDMSRARTMQQEQLDAGAMQAGAFGGSRHGVAGAESNRNFYDRLGAMTSGLRQQNFGNAQNMALADIGNTMQADMSNQQADIANARIAAQQHQNQFGNLMQGAQTFSGLADQGFGFGQDITRQQMAQGALTRGLNQQTIDAGRQQFSNFTNAGNMGLSPLAQFVSGNYGSTTTESNNPGILGTIGAGVQLASAFCWVAREVYGPSNPEWLDFREWMLTKAPSWLRKAYIKHGPGIAGWVKRHPWSKRVLRPVMDWLKG